MVLCADVPVLWHSNIINGWQTSFAAFIVEHCFMTQLPMQSKVTALKRETALIFLAHTNLMCFEWIPKEMIGLFCRLSTYRMSSDFWISINSMEQLIFNLSKETFPNKDIAQSIEYAKMLDVQRPPISHLKHCFYPIYFQFHSVNKMHTPKDNTKRTETELHRNRNQITFYYTHKNTKAELK